MDWTVRPARPLLTYFNVIVAEADLPKIEAHLNAKGERIRYAADVPEKDALTINMIRKLRRDACLVAPGEAVPREAAHRKWPSRAVTGGRVHYRPSPATNVSLITPDQIDEANAAGRLGEIVGKREEKADAFFDAIPETATADDARKRMVKDVLIRAVHRGLDPTAAEHIRQRLNLPAAMEAQDGR